MSITADQILAHPALDSGVRHQAEALLLARQASPRTASLFATQQRWLMSQAALATYFRTEAEEAGAGVLAERFIDHVAHREIATRNTAAAFLQEMLKYGIVRHVAASAGKRHRPFEPSPPTLTMMLHWLAVHLATLDGLDGRARLVTLLAGPVLLGAIQPKVADGLLGATAERMPDKTLSLLTWVNDGGIVMDRLIAGCPDDATDLARIPTDIMSVSSLAEDLNLPRSQLSRKFAVAEAMGNLGWFGARGNSALWVSAGFRREYHVAQAAKLAIIDAAFAAALTQRVRDRVFNTAMSV